MVEEYHEIREVRPGFGFLKYAFLTAAAMAAIITAYGCAHKGAEQDRAPEGLIEDVSITAQYPMDFDRDGCSDKVRVEPEGLYVQTHSVHGYGDTAGLTPATLALPLEHRLTDVIVTHHDHDGNLDIIAIGPYGSCPEDDGWKRYIMRGRGDGAFHQPITQDCIKSIGDYNGMFNMHE